MNKTSVASIGVRELIKALIPRVIEAGDFALTIQGVLQSGVPNPVPQKESANPFAAALTPADIAVEDSIGVFLLANYDDVKFHGEEHERDNVSWAFPEHARFTVTLDPIDGTKFFKDGLPIFAITMTFLEDGKIVGALDYLPAKGELYIAVNDRAFEAHRGSFGVWYELNLRPIGLDTTLLVHRCTPSEKEVLKRTGFQVIDLTSYTGKPDWGTTVHDLIRERIAGFIIRDGNLLDWGAVAFIAGVAGGAHTPLDFDPVTLRIPQIIAANGQVTFKKMQSALAEAAKK